MAWPTPQDYNEAVQNPRLAFSDADLINGRAELNQLGIPRAIAGNFACVYKIQTNRQRWAARCFNSEVSDQQRRYEAISTYLAKVALAYTVQFTYMPTGIKVQGKPYPLLKMEWVQGESLTVFVGRSIGYSDTLLSLAKVWARMMADLREVGIAHGDLQHGNVLVVGDQLRLIDYDGMFVPGLAGQQSNECGHRNYQLPSRTGWDYGPYLDNFSAWVIFVSLVALAVHPELWSKYGGGDECLIFRKEDFERPESSALLLDLSASPNTQLRLYVELFTSFFNLSPQDVPSLDGNITKITIEPPRPWWIDQTTNLPPRKTSPVEVKPTKEVEVATPDPGWIVDSLSEDEPVKQLAFQGQTGEVRIIVLGSLTLMILTRLFVEIPSSELLVAYSCALSFNFLLCYIRYKSDPSRIEYEAFKKDFKAFMRQVDEHQAVMDAISAEKLTVQSKLAESRREIAAKKNSLGISVQTDLNSAQLELNSQLQVLNQRRKDTASSETKKLNVIQDTLVTQISDLDRKIRALVQKESDDKVRMLDSLRDMHIQNYLRGCLVRSSPIPGIGETYKARLAYSGFATAADINGRVRSVQGIGQAREAALMSWRQSMVSMALRSAPSLSSVDSQTIEYKYRQERQTLESERQRLQAQSQSQVSSVRQYFADVRQSVNDEERQLQVAGGQRKIRIQQEYDAKIVTLDKEATVVKNQAAPTLNELSQKLQNAQKQIFALKWQSAKKEKVGRRFASLRFRDYLRTMIVS
ncbi:MAG TPA: hypothetical protein VGO67_20195 [Verrucomicrobiae bacterium]|jgi:hypothetical protein